MNTSTSQAYEASIQNASIVISNSEWINEFKQGIQLKKGDSVRLLGSFINEQSNGEEIEVTDDMIFNLEYSPFIKGQTFFTADKRTDLINLGKLGDIPYSTDSFGIEPPGFWFSSGQQAPPVVVPPIPTTVVPSAANIASANWTWDCSQNDLYKNVYMTGTSSLNYNNGGAEWKAQNNEAITWGTNIRTYDKRGNAPAVHPATNTSATIIGDRKILDDWSNFSCSNELYIGELCKKLILPKIDTINSSKCPGGVAVSNLEPLQRNPPLTGYGCLSGIPKPGMLIATVDIGYASGFYDDDGNAYFQAAGHVHGQPNLMTGVQSVVGTILAVRPIKRNFRGKQTECFEVYVYDWVNPGKYRSKNIRRTNLDSTHFRTIRSNKRELAIVKTGLPTINLTTQIHGAGELENGYNTNSSSNNINGPYSQSKTITGSEVSNNNNQIMSGVPDTYTFDGYTPGLPNGDGKELFNQSSLNNNISDYQYGIGKPQGLSFLWNGTYGGQHRHPDYTSINSTNFYPARASSNQIFNPQNKTLSMNYQDTQTSNDVGNGNPGEAGDCLNPCCYGAFVICQKETMIDIINGVYTNIDEGRGDGFQSRIWMDYSVQIGQSGYNERHYAGNSYTQTSFAGGGSNGFDSEYQSPIAGIPAKTEYRYDLEMMGKPQSQNWRLRGQAGYLEPYSTQNIGAFTFEGATTRGGVNTSDPNYIGDGSNNIMSTQLGFNAIQWLHTGLSGGAPPGHNGCPFVNATYETTTNSIHFQDKNTGDVNLGINQDTGIANGDYFYYTNNAQIAPNSPPGTIIQLTGRYENNNQTPLVGAYVWCNSNDGLSDYIMKIASVVVVNPNSFQITLDKSTGSGIIFTESTWYISPTTSPSITGAGTEAIPWVSDLIILRQKTAKYSIPAGFYTEEQLANEINDRLHDSSLRYKKQYGNSTGAVPTNIGLSETNYPSQNTCVNGNFVHTYLPDVNFGFTPITNENATELDLTPSTKDMTQQLITYEVEDDVGGGLIFYGEGDFPAYNGTTVRYVTDNPTQYPTIIGKKTKIYSIPYLNKDSGELNPQIHMFRLKGGALNFEDADKTDATPAVFQNWELEQGRFAGFYEGLRDLRTHTGGANNTALQGSAYSQVWRTRLNRNLFVNGGSAKLFIGANNLTLSFVDAVNKYSLNNLYTPLRPSLSENAQKTDFGIDDATPSAIIGAELTGEIEDMLSGIYIDRLVGDPFTQENYGYRWYNNELYDTLLPSEIEANGRKWWNTLGFNDIQINKYNNSFSDVKIPFVFNGELYQEGNALRVGTKITPSINGTNPFASNCTLVNPVQQYFVEVNTDDFFAVENSRKGTDPYYYIGSDFPTKQFFGDSTGAKLPVIGICARNFHSFNFAFDLGASAISYTIDQDVTITSIHTSIYRNNLKAPTNLSKFSSIIYLITKPNYYRPLPTEFDQIKQQMIQENYSQPYEPLFYNQSPANYRSQPPPVLPKNYYVNEGVLPEAEEDDNEEDIF